MLKKILIGTHNKGKFKEISCLLSKKYKKISPLQLKIKSPKETGKTFSSNSRLKAKFFSKYVNYCKVLLYIFFLKIESFLDNLISSRHPHVFEKFLATIYNLLDDLTLILYDCDPFYSALVQP